ncbi:hypothetical protein ACROYT_G037082 [Oculina patagonica]
MLVADCFGDTQAAVMDGHGNPINNYRGKDCSEVRCDWPRGVCTYIYDPCPPGMNPLWKLLLPSCDKQMLLSLLKPQCSHSRSQSLPFLLVTWSAKRRALVTLTTGCRKIHDIR